MVIRALERKKQKAILTQRTKAEQDLVVAAASILARAAFLEGLGQLEERWATALPKGASAKTIESGKILIEKHGAQALPQVAKMYFKTAQLVLTNEK